MKPAPPADPDRVEALFDALVDLDPEEAARLLDLEASSDPVLLEAVEQLLLHHRKAGRDFLRPNPALMREALHAEPGQADPDPMPLRSKRLGRFEVLHKLGEGGMGVVYAGYDEGLDRRVALKVLHPGAAASGWLLREGQALGRLAHPNIVAVHEVGEQDGHVFLAMELVLGPTLQVWLEERPRVFSEVLSMFVQAGRGLACAHEAGLIHRDFKPDNVVIGANDARARVMDFGLAALALGARPDEVLEQLPTPPSALASPLTRSHALMGTLAFMSPQQLRGERATALSDQWSFCVALYRAVYGASPFPTTDLDTFRSAVLAGARISVPRRPGVPSWLGPILAKGLAHAPDERFASMQHLLTDIARHIPPDPDLDPLVVASEREILSWVFVAALLVITTPMLFESGVRFMISPAGLVGVPLCVLAPTLVLLALRWKRIGRNLYGRRFAGILPFTVVILVLHRIVALELGSPGTHILVGDLVVMTAFFATLGLTQDRWVVLIGLIAGAAALVGASDAARAPFLFGSAGLLAMFALIVRVFVDRQLARDARDAAHE